VAVRDFLCCVLRVLDGVQLVAVRQMRMVAGLLVVAGLFVLRSFAMMHGRMFVMLRGFGVMMVDRMFAHGKSP
jgi:hypothetical protein